MAKSTALLGIDLGTSSCKALLLADDGTILATDTAAYDVSIPRPGWSEQDPADWIAGARSAVRGVLRKVQGVKVIGVGLSGQMHGLTPLDRDHRVLRPAILWNDQRNAAECAEITERAGGLDGLLRLTNNQMLIGYTGGKIVWLRNHEPEIFEAMRHVLNPKDYLRLHLTGELATEVSDASGTGLFDTRARTWSEPLLRAIGLDSALLPTCHESDVVSGQVTARAAEAFGLEPGTPVVGGGGDAVVQSLGSGVIEPGDLQTTIGTAGIVACALKEPVSNSEGRLQVFCNVAPDHWHCMGVSLNAGGALAWFHQLVSGACEASGGGASVSIDQLVATAEDSPAGSRSLLFLPYLNGERCPHSDPTARGAFVGLGAYHTHADMVRSLMEGVVFSLKDICELMRDAGIGVTRLRTSGGGARSKLWRQIQADIFECDVVVPDGAAEGGALGAALVAGVGTGVWPDARAAAGTCRPGSPITADPGVRDRYRHLFKRYRALYPALNESFEGLARDLDAVSGETA